MVDTMNKYVGFIFIPFTVFSAKTTVINNNTDMPIAKISKIEPLIMYFISPPQMELNQILISEP